MVLSSSAAMLSTLRITCEINVSKLEFRVNPLAARPCIVRMAEACSCSGEVKREEPDGSNQFNI